MPSRKRAVVVTSCEKPTAGCLSVVRVETGRCVLSTGEELLIRFDKLQALTEQLCQDGSPVWVRTWQSRDGTELIEIHRLDGVAPSTPETSGDIGTVF